MFPNVRRTSLPITEPGARKECRTFEPQQWRRSVCKNCFRTEPEHIAAATTPVTTTSGVSGESTLPAANAWPTTPALSRKTIETPPQRLTGQAPTAVRKAGQRSGEELQRGNFAGHRATPAPNQAPPSQALGPADRVASSGPGGVFSSASSIDARYVEELENDFFDLEDKYDTLVRERNDLSMDLETKLRSIEDLQASLEQYKEKVNSLERRCAHLEEEIKTYRERLRLPESDQGGVGEGTVELKTALEVSECGGDLKTRLNQVEQLCQDVMEENEALKEEIEEMQREIEEMHDHFQEEDKDSMREVQRDLEAANKTCRILQFKLRKTERRFEQVEAERANLEERLARLESQVYSEMDIGHIRILEEELRVAKEVTVRLNNDLDIVEEKRHFYENENHQLKDELQICQNRRITLECEVDRLRLEFDKLKHESRFAERGPLQVTDKKAGRQSTPLSVAHDTTLSTEKSELIGALQTTKEREADLSEQLRFAEEELRKMNRRIAEAQADNNALSRQLDRLSTQQARGESPRATASQIKKEFAANQQEVRRVEDDENAEKVKALQDALELSNETNKAISKRINQLANDLLILKVNHRDIDWLAKYNEAVEAQKDFECQVNTMKRKLAESAADLPGALITMIESRRPLVKSSDSRSAMSKDWLLQKLESYDKEMADLETEITLLRNAASSLKLQSQRIGDEYAEFRAGVDEREGELRSHIEYLEKKDFVISELLELIIQNSNLLQAKIERSNKVVESGKVSTELEEELKNLKQLLDKEREKARIMEDQLKSGTTKIPRPMLSENERARLKEIEVLKTQLEDKDEQIEDNESRIRDLWSRLERAKKMNEAMKTLIDKDTVEMSRTQFSVSTDSAYSSMENKQNAIEINSYRREIDSMRKEIAILQQKVMQIEKVREKLLLENKDLQEELKLREDSLFDQDDELEKRNADLVKAKRALELMQIELNEARKGLAAARAQEGMSTKISSTLAENEQLKSELRRLVEELKVSNSNLEKARAAEIEALENCKKVSQELKAKEGEKDDLVREANAEAQRREEELNSARNACTEAQMKVKKLESTIVELQARLQQQRDGWRTESSSLDGGISRDSSRESRRIEVDRLRRECTALRQERDEIVKEARRDRQIFEKRLQEASYRLNCPTDLSSSALASGASGDLYSRALTENQIGKKLSLLNEHIVKHNSIVSQLRIKNEIIQNKMLEYQRRYANLKEQYEAEQEVWLSERVVLESKAKEQEERKYTIANTRRSLQETSTRLAETEAKLEKERLRFDTEKRKLESEKYEINVELAHLKEQQKLPKVLQRFSASPARSGHLGMATTNTSDKVTAQRLDSAEKTIVRLKSELQNRLQAQSYDIISAIQDAETARAAAECQLDCLNEQLLQMDLYREQADMFRERLLISEQGADREYKIWTEEREDLLCQIEDLRISVEQWCIRLAHRDRPEGGMKSDELVNDIVAEMERWQTCRQHLAMCQRRSCSTELHLERSHMSDTQSMMGESMISTPATHPKTPLSAGHQSTTMDPFSRSANGFQGSTVSLAAGISSSLVRSVTPSLARCGRSVSPVCIRKITNYPDPTPGFLIRSRQASVDSLGSINDFTQRPFTSPGKPPLRQPISPARRKFFEDTSTPDLSSSISKTESFTFPLSSFASSNVVIKNPIELRHASIVKATAATPIESTVEKASLPSTEKSSTPSVLSRISSKLTGSKTDITKHKASTSLKEKPSQATTATASASSSTSRSKSPKSKKKEIALTQTKSSDASSTEVPKSRELELTQTMAPRIQSKPSSVMLKTGRSGSLNSSPISPSIMALRQKFGGK